MGIENVQTIKAHDSWSQDYIQDSSAEEATHPLDSPKSIATLSKLSDWWDQERESQAENRYQMALDEDFYDGLQWKDEDKIELEHRGQLPYVFNRIKPSIDWVSGSEKRMRFDFKLFPRRPDGIDTSEVKTELLKYVGDVNKTQFSKSRAFKQCIIGGLGWLEEGIRNDPTEEPLFVRSESWRNVWYDHLSTELDLSDARYLFRAKWVDLDIAEMMFPDRKEVLQAAAMTANLYGDDNEEFYYQQDSTNGQARQAVFDSSFSVGNRRQRTRLVEAWYVEPAQVQIMRGFPRIEGDLFDDNDPFKQQLVEQGYASVYDALRMQMRCAVFVAQGTQATNALLQDMPSPYRHNRFPLTPIWCYRRGRDNSPYGIVRNLRDPQEDLNKRRSKALFALSSKGIVADEDAFEDWDEAAEELARPDMMLKHKKGAKVEIRSDNALAEEHVMLMQEDARYIQDVSGVTDENLGRQTNATSGVAITARQDQGALTTAEVFDNYRLAAQLQGEKQLSLVEQFYDQPKIVRIVGPRGQVEFQHLNEPTDDLDNPFLNDITASQSDFVIDEIDFHQSVRMALFEQLMGMLAKLPPEMALQLLDLAIELIDLPNSEEMVQRVRKLNGQPDPNAQNDPVAQEKTNQAELASQQEAQAQSDMQSQSMMQQLQEQAAKIRKLLADAELQAQKAKTEQAHQQAILAKPALDAAKIRQDRAKSESDVQDKQHRQRMDRVKMVQDTIAEDAPKSGDDKPAAKPQEPVMQQVEMPMPGK